MQLGYRDVFVSTGGQKQGPHAWIDFFGTAAFIGSFCGIQFSGSPGKIVEPINLTPMVGVIEGFRAEFLNRPMPWGFGLKV